MGRLFLVLAGLLTCAAAAPGQAPDAPPSPNLAGVWLHGRDAPPVEDGNPFPSCWLQTRALVWGLKSAPLRAPLAVVLGDPPPTLAPLAGDVNFGVAPGVQVLAGVWLDGSSPIGLEVSGFALVQQSPIKARKSSETSSAQIERPVIDAVTQQFFSVAVSVEGQRTGQLEVAPTSQFWGVEGNARLAVLTCEGCRVEALVGLRYLGLRERLTITQSTLGLAVPIDAGAFGPVTRLPLFRVVDRFACHNEFFGPQAGLRGEWIAEPCWFAATAKLGLGAAEQKLRIDGATTYTAFAAGTGVVSPGGQIGSGLLAGPSNIGSYRRTRFAAVAEGSLEAGIQVCSWLDVTAGYTFVYWSSVLRPGDQIDPRVNLAGFPLSPTYAAGPTNPALPAAVLRTGDFWAQGLTVGLQIVY